MGVYCATVEISMGRALVALIDYELTCVAETSVADSPVLAQRARERLASREAEVASREQAVASVEESQSERQKQLHRWEAEIQTLAQRVQLTSKLAAQHGGSTPKVGRNDRCPCGSGLKHKHSHGLPARPPSVVPR